MRSVLRVALYWLAFAWIFCNADPVKADVIIRGDHGGQIMEYLDYYAEVGKSGKKVVIDGDCLSACTLVLGFVPPERLCVTPKAKLGFHAAGSLDKTGRAVHSKVGTQILWEFYPPKIHRWLKQHGGLTKKLVYLQGSQLDHMYRPCTHIPQLSAQASAPLRITITPKAFNAFKLY